MQTLKSRKKILKLKLKIKMLKASFFFSKEDEKRKCRHSCYGERLLRDSKLSHSFLFLIHGKSSMPNRKGGSNSRGGLVKFV